MNIECKNDFLSIAKRFEREKILSLTTVSCLIEYIRLHKRKINAEEAKALLEIPIEVLKNSYLICPKRYVEMNRCYFSGNITWTEEPFTSQWKSRFEGKFDLNEIIELTEIVANNFEKYSLASEFLLRNAEVTIRDDIKLSNKLDRYKYYEKIMKVLSY